MYTSLVVLLRQFRAATFFASTISTVVLIIMLHVVSGLLHADPSISASGNIVYLPFITRNCSSVITVTSYTSSRWWNQNLQTYQTVGEITNTSSVAIQNTKVTLRVFNLATRQEIMQEERSVFLSETKPGQTNPFKIEWSNNPNINPQLQWEVTATCETTLSGQTYTELRITSQGIQSESEFRVFGTVQNTLGTSISTFTTAVSIIDDQGSIIDTSSYRSETPLLPGATAPFTVTFNKIYSDFADISATNTKVQAQGILLQDNQ